MSSGYAAVTTPMPMAAAAQASWWGGTARFPVRWLPPTARTQWRRPAHSPACYCWRWTWRPWSNSRTTPRERRRNAELMQSFRSAASRRLGGSRW